MDVNSNIIDTWLKPPTASNLPWAGTPEIKFEVYFEQKVLPGDRIKMGMAKQPDGHTKEIFYEITAVIRREQSTGHYTDDLITAIAKRITV